jgi:hypothetical protein
MNITTIRKADGNHDEVCVKEIDENNDRKDTHETYPKAFMGFKQKHLESFRDRYETNDMYEDELVFLINTAE